MANTDSEACRTRRSDRERPGSFAVVGKAWDEEGPAATLTVKLKAIGVPDGAGDDPVGLAVAGEWRPSAPLGAEATPHGSGHVGPITLSLTGPIPMYANFWIRFPSKVSVV